MKSTSPYEPRFPLIYVLNNLEEEEFSVDLWELFGSEDSSKKALVGKWDRSKNDFKSITWDWSKSNIKHIFNICYFLSRLKGKGGYDQEVFESLYRSEMKRSRDLVDSFPKFGLEKPVYCLYVMKYKRQFPALMIEWEKIEQRPERKRPLLITFKPRAYFVIDPETWNEAKMRARTKDEWASIYQFSKDQNANFTGIFKPYKNMKQSIYGLMPWSLFFREISKSRITFFKPVERLDREFIIPDNLIFWELFREITGAKREQYTAKLDTKYAIEGIPIDAFSTESNVFRHEAGAANVLLHSLLKHFGDKYLTKELGNLASISYKQCTIFKREYQVKKVPGEEKNEYGEADYDYALELKKLGPDALLLVDLTTALWRKGLLSYEEYIARWKETCFNVPTKGRNVFFIWYVAINKTEHSFFHDPPPNPLHNNFDEMITALSSDNSSNDFLVVSKESDLSSYSGQKVIIVKVFRTAPASKNVGNELEMLLRDYEQSLFYKTCSVILKQIIT